ncbi:MULTISPECIES: PilN domain-containing protein [Snodgrassella]|uniref:PilN domain-containing protein n=1 Tax=Snodgrassella TaxID=1193515 RepID=UPI002269BF9A|nr:MULTISPECIES: PilN domain-containing protein [unclassified Snodgrassella]MCX8747188.1 PilN domain-containing protein [Snodgrassella sp. B3800]MCX8748955.1 PilN domain-containing protein [Snodgrassella sp. B3088]MCX8754197.1 PilN domain-containing protein [Snodgrassella sp. B3837]
MLPLLKINLLPYREALQTKQKKQFQTLLAVAALIGVGLAVLGYLAIDSRVSSQEARNQVLKDGIDKLDGEIKQIAQLQDERKNFTARQEKVEELSNKRFEAARILDTLNTLAPLGLYITSIEAQDANTYVINGKAFSDAKTAAFMNALPGQLFTTPELLNIKRVNNTQEFSIRIRLNNLIGQQEDMRETNQAINPNSSSTELNQDTEAPHQENESSASEPTN